MKRKILSLILAFAMTAGMNAVSAAAAQPIYGDIADNWAKKSVERWSERGIIRGSNGKFVPEGELTCAQLAAIIARLLKLPAADDAGFNDNDGKAWYFDDINRCAAAGIINGNGDGTVTPNAPVSRERSMVILARALEIEPIENPDLTKFGDQAAVSPYAAGYIAALIEAGIVGGVSDDRLAPQAEINRASTAAILDRAIGTYADEDGQTVKINDKGIALVVADKVTVAGHANTLIIAGQNNNVKLEGITADKINVAGENLKLELNNAEVKEVVAAGKNAAVETKGNTKVENIVVSEDAKGAAVNVGSSTAVGNIKNNAESIKITGSGKVNNVESDKNLIIETKNTKIKNSGDQKITVTGKNGKESGVDGGKSSVVKNGSGSVTVSRSDTGASSYEHTHAWDTEWKFDQTAHWHECTAENCTIVENSEKDGYAEHSFDENTHKCECGATDSSVVAIVGDDKCYIDLAQAISKENLGETVKLLKNITLAERIDVQNFDGTIDLNGYTIASTETCKNGSVFDVKSGNVTIKNGDMIGIAGPTGLAAPYENECDVITVRAGAVVNLEDVNISVDSRTGACVYAFAGSTVNIKSGEYTNEATLADVNGRLTAMLLNQADNADQAIFVTGGTFHGANPANGDNSGKPATFLAPGYESTGTERNWVVSEKAGYYVVQVGSEKYETLEKAIKAAQPVDGVITYTILGKAEIGDESCTTAQWIPVTDKQDVTSVKFVGNGDDAEISLKGKFAVLADQANDLDITFENLTLSHENGEWIDDLGHATNYFACVMRNTNAKDNTVTYIDCTFPNGACNNQYGKTEFNGCVFNNGTDGKYDLWHYGGSTEITDCEFTGVRGIKAYSEGTDGGSISINDTSFDGLTQKAAVVVSKAANVTMDNVSIKECNKGLLEKAIENASFKSIIKVEGTGICGNFNITAESTEEAAEAELNITGGIFEDEPESMYIAAGYKAVEKDGSWHVVSDASEV